MKISDFSLLDENDSAGLEQVVHEFNRTATLYPSDRTIHGLFSEEAAKRPEAVAVIAAGETLTYRELDERSNRLAHFLIAQGVAAEQAVGVMLSRSAEMIVALLGILKAGGCYLPLNPTLPASRARYILTEARCPFLISEKSLIRTLNKLQWDCPELRGFLCLDSLDVRLESEGSGEMMREEMWDYIRREVFDDISGGGWKSSYTGEWLSREVMDEYGDNILAKLSPWLRPDARILEIGCASGISMFRLAPKIGFYLGTDLSGEIVRWSQAEQRRRGLENIRLEQAAAHEIDKLGAADFDIVILNSVVQCFSGHNYLRDVIRKAIGLMREGGMIFFGNIWDQNLKEEFVGSLTRFANDHAAGGYATKIDRSEELFLSRGFFEDLRHEFPEVAEIEFSGMLGAHASELSEYGYDAIVRIDKRRNGNAGRELPPRRKQQFDRTALAGCPVAAMHERSGARALAYIIYTSGTSGSPKGVMIEHRSVVRLVRNTNYLELGEADRILQTGALAFDASTFEIWGALLNGASVCLPPGEELLDVQALGGLIRQHGITTMFLTTGLFNVLVDAGIEVFRGLKRLLTGGERCSAAHFHKLREAFPELAVQHVYGPTENTTFTTFYDVSAAPERDIPIGRPISNTTVYILDDQLKPVPIGVPGELCAGGDGLARAYLNDPALTRDKFIPHPFLEGERLYRTGDLCRWRADGNVEFIGRRDNQVKVRGYRVELEEIEACLCRHESVTEALVLAKDLGGGTLDLIAYVTGDDGLEIEELKSHLAATVPAYMVPAYFIPLKKLPLNASGKIDRKALPDPVASPARDARPHEAPETETERQLAAIWQEVLGHNSIGVTDDFFAAGGHSLKVTKLVALIHARMGVTMPLTAVFKATTIREQARLLVEGAQFGVEGMDEAMMPLTNAAGDTAIFALPPGTGDALGYLQLAELLKPHRFYAFNFIPRQTRLAEYADLIMSVDPDGPWLLLGYSAGGNLAFHVAAELERRGGKVSDIVMIDSSRRVRPLVFPEGEADRVARAFLAHESIKPYLTCAPLWEKAYRNIGRYYEYLATTDDHHIVEANIHVLVTCDSNDDRDPVTGDLIASVPRWVEATRRAFKIYPADGEHNTMLYPPHLELNARLLRGIIEEAFAGAKKPDAPQHVH